MGVRKLFVVLILTATLAGCSGPGALTPTAPTPAPLPTGGPPPSLGELIGSISQFWLDPGPNSGGVGENIARLSSGTVEVRLHVTGSVTVSLHWKSGGVTGNTVGERVQTAGEAVMLPVVGDVNYVRIANATPAPVTGGAEIFHLR